MFDNSLKYKLSYEDLIQINTNPDFDWSAKEIKYIIHPYSVVEKFNNHCNHKNVSLLLIYTSEKWPLQVVQCFQCKGFIAGSALERFDTYKNIDYIEIEGNNNDK